MPTAAAYGGDDRREEGDEGERSNKHTEPRRLYVGHK
jgi:hypothetical protein